jgi:glutamyl-tRNA synthetase
MNETQLRVRFAPSPTGFLHVGGARTALFNWLLARHAGGVFILRIEDTDRSRSEEAMTTAILEGLGWLGLDWDEGPFHQADGIERHRADALRLLETGHAYRCFCTPAALEERRAAAGGAPDAYRYDRHCMRTVPSAIGEQRAAAGEPHTIRFRVPDGRTEWRDAVHGAIGFDNADIEDFIVLRTDGSPIYNLAVVSDDVAMHVNLVLRGDDHISNTPKQVMLYRALGHETPSFAHVPLILGTDGKRLSKRHGATAVGEYRHQGILPEAMMNFLALLGWNPGTEEEIFSPAELVERFSLERINRKSAVFDPEKLLWMNAQHLSRKPASELVDAFTEQVTGAGLASAAELRAMGPTLPALIDLLKPRARVVADLHVQAAPYLADRVQFDEAAVAGHWKDPAATAERLARLRARLAAVESWQEEPLEKALRDEAAELGVGAGKLIHPLRLALLGVAVSPGIFEVLVYFGRARTLGRIDAALDELRRRAA